MSSKFHALTVILEADADETAVANLKAAILQLRGVLSVEPHTTNLAVITAERRARQELLGKLRQLLQEA